DRTLMGKRPGVGIAIHEKIEAAEEQEQWSDPAEFFARFRREDIHKQQTGEKEHHPAEEMMHLVRVEQRVGILLLPEDRQIFVGREGYQAAGLNACAPLVDQHRAPMACNSQED